MAFTATEQTYVFMPNLLSAKRRHFLKFERTSLDMFKKRTG
jgi:hypothetical protein